MTIAEILGACIGRLRTLPSRIWRLEANWKGICCDASVLFLGRPLISRHADSEMIFSEGVRIHSALRSNPLGCFQPSVLRTMAAGARLELGKNVGMSGTILCAGKSIVIGENTIIGSGVMILDNDLHVASGEGRWRGEYVQNAREICIGRGVFVGARAIILKGVTVGDGAIIGAGAVVTHDVPEGMIVAGNPATVIRRRLEL